MIKRLFGANSGASNALAAVAFALATALPVPIYGQERGAAGPNNESIVTSRSNSTPVPKQKKTLMRTAMPKGILDPILTEAAKLANVPREELVIVRAEAVVWSDGSLGCPEPGMEYAQALVNGYWVVIEAAGQTYDFRVSGGGSFRLCPQGRGRAPLPPDANRDGI